IKKAHIVQPARILSVDGKELGLFKRANRVWVKLPDISPSVVHALIDTEDRRFYEHHGLDFTRTAGAALNTLTGDRQGGSTITQQLARNLYPDEIGRAPSLTRKIKEAITALKIEAVYSKDEILETYLNTVPFLYNAYGIEMAARTYFDKPASKLTVLESATLVGMLKGTAYYNPVMNPERAEQRRNTVMAQMVKRGDLTDSEFQRLKQRPLKVNFEMQDEPSGPAPHFMQQLRKWLINWADENDYDIYADGLVVHTTIDSRLQNWATQAVSRQGNQLQNLANSAWSGKANGWSPAVKDLVRAFVRESSEFKTAVSKGESEDDALKRLQADADFMKQLRAQKTLVQAGFMALDPQSGEIRAWVGSRDFEQDKFDHVQQARRQPGSTFKPFVYAAAFLQGAKPDDTFVDEVPSIPVPGGGVWRPTDGGAPSGAPMTLRNGLVYSKNTITAQVMQKVGPAKVASLARDMGVKQSKLDEVLSLALGTSPVTLYEMVSAYGTIANGGHYIEPRFVTRIEDRHGKVLAEFAMPKPKSALPLDTDRTLIDVMRGVVTRGTGAGIRSRYGLRGDLAGKTGTTQDNTDGWFILMHGQLVAGAWVGFNDNRVTLRSDYWGQGAHSALPIVGEFFSQVQRNRMLDPKARLGQPNGALGDIGEWAESVTEPASAPDEAASAASDAEAASAPAGEPTEIIESGGGPAPTTTTTPAQATEAPAPTNAPASAP
ncbi:MAG TPA: transglycosylase domain-containing protein, partial [Aquabacterium sp.]|nr:transglycosylase domain-containing protein [Aquabacterium sp.]